MKKTYFAPEAEVVSFYSAEEVTANDEQMSEKFELGDLPEGWT